MGIMSGFTDMLFGSDQSGDGGAGASREAIELQKQMMKEWERLRAPTREELSYDIPGFEYAGDLTPEQMRMIQAGPSSFEDIEMDPRLREYQMQTLQGLDQISQEGLTDADKAMLYQIARQQEAEAQGARGALTQEFAQRTGGVSGSGMEILQKQLANQAAASDAAQQGMDVAGMAAQRKLAALQALGQQSGSIRGQEFGEQADIAKAKDMLNQFNSQMRANQEATNVAAINQARERNLAMRQNQSNLNTGVRQQRARQASDIAREMYSNRVGQLQGKTAAATGASSSLQSEAARLAQERANRAAQEGGVMSTIGTLGAAYMMSDRNNKTNIAPLSDQDAQDILNKLTPYKFDYKNPEKYGVGEQNGIMAQDLEKSPAGQQFVTNTDAGKVVNYDPAMITAFLSNLNKRVKKVEGEE